MREQNLIIYEVHVGDFTPEGTYLALASKAPYLRSLGINAVELLPIFTCPDPKNVWGYSPSDFFKPDPRYADQDPVAEFKEMVHQLHDAGIEVILDVVYNHTGSPLPPEYYILGPNGEMTNYSGCGNTLSPHSPPCRRLIMESLRHWSQEMGVDGFRFDLASILTRGEDGAPLDDPPLLRQIESDPALRGCRLIAEPWDAAGLYQVGQFPKWGNWLEWNGPYRDQVRRFLRGDGNGAEFAECLSGSPHLYDSPTSSINFVTCHDGFSLHDLVSYNEKQNKTPGDGADENYSWDCGPELRDRQMRNFLLALFTSLGTPMLYSGDEIGLTKGGNNNTWNQNIPFDWSQTEGSFPKFVSKLAEIRQQEFSRTLHYSQRDATWFTEDLALPDWSDPMRFVALCVEKRLYLAFNAQDKQVNAKLPAGSWEPLVDTANGELLENSYKMEPYSAILMKRLPA
jgi:isoamylase